MEAARQQALFDRPAPVVALLRGQCSLEQAVEELEKLLPAYNGAARPLLEILKGDPRQLAVITTLVREIRPFLPINESWRESRRSTPAATRWRSSSCPAARRAGWPSTFDERAQSASWTRKS